MAHEIHYNIPNVKDDVLVARALQAFELAREIPGAQPPRLNFSVAGENIAFDPAQRDAFDELIQSVTKANGYFVHTVTLACPVPANNRNDSLSITISRPQSAQSAVASFKATFPNGAQGNAGRVAAVQAVAEVFEPIDPVQSAVELGSGDPGAYLKALEGQLQQAFNAAQEQTERVTTALRDQAKQNTLHLTAERERLQAQFDTRAGELDQRERALEERAEGLDLADAKTSRRKLREGLREKLDDLATDFALTKQTTAERRWLLWTLFTAILVAVGLVVQAGMTLHKNPSDLPTLGRLLGASALFGGLLIYFIRWQSAWVQHRTTEELRLLNTSLDMERASWVLESLIELKDEKVEVMPDALLEAVTRNLFAKPGEQASVNTPMDDLADILRDGAESVKIKQGENEITLNRSGLKRLRKMSQKPDAAE